jgi:hypothetical protein
MKTYITRKGMKVETTMSDGEALKVLSSIAHKSNFAMDLCEKAQQYGLSYDQMAWAHKLANDERARASGQREQPALSVDLSSVRNVLLRARANGLKWPKVRLAVERVVGGHVAGHDPVVLSLAGQQSKYAGSVNVTDGGRFGENKWYGRINVSGSWSPSSSCEERVTALLVAFGADPAGHAKLHGQLTGCCCYCGRELTTKESVGAGYGPICAEKFGLPWGAETAVQYEARKEEAIKSAGEALAEQGAREHHARFVESWEREQRETSDDAGHHFDEEFRMIEGGTRYI